VGEIPPRKVEMGKGGMMGGGSLKKLGWNQTSESASQIDQSNGKIQLGKKTDGQSGRGGPSNCCKNIRKAGNANF